MDILGNARGNITRQTNKKLRRERIMGVAQDMIANGGLEAFTLSGLAAETGAEDLARTRAALQVLVRKKAQDHI